MANEDERKFRLTTMPAPSLLGKPVRLTAVYMPMPLPSTSTVEMEVTRESGTPQLILSLDGESATFDMTEHEAVFNVLETRLNGDSEPELEFRLRREDDDLIITFKLKEVALGSRPEANLKANDHPQIFEALWLCHVDNPTIKDRFPVTDFIEGAGDDDDGVVYVDQYLEELSGLVLAEREFPESSAMAAWQPPEWMTSLDLKEVTGLKPYKNRSLARDGMPKE
ncbi:hypothetical protein BH11PAT4_BH11PAT4_7750 [soil metagenome]